MAEYSIKQKKGQDYVPTAEELLDEEVDLIQRYDALFDLQLSDTKEQIEKRQFDERRPEDRDPDFTTEI